MANGVDIAKAYVHLIPSMEGAQGAITDAIVPGASKAGDTAGRGMGRGMGSGLKAAFGAAAITAAVGTVVSFAKESIESLARIEVLNTQTETVLKSTGNAANTTRAHIEELTGALEASTATEAESIQEGANLLLTFKNISNGVGEGNDIFDQSVTAMNDMARAMGTDVKGGAVQLGKALNDPIKGISALSKVGITFSEEQKEMIKSMTEAGDVAGAQKIILSELNSQFGGSGAAYAGTYAGQMELLGHSVGTLGETIMSTLMPHLLTLGEALTTAFTWFEANPDALIVVTSLIGVGLVAAFVAWASSIWAANAALLASPWTYLVLAIIALVAGIVYLATQTTFFQDVWAAVWGFIQDTMTNAGNLIDTVLNWISETWNTVWGAISTFAQDTWNGMIGFIGDSINNVKLIIQLAILAIQMTWTAIWTFISTVASNIWNGIVWFITAYINTVLLIISTVISTIQAIWTNSWNFISTVALNVWNGIVWFVTSYINMVLSIISTVISTISAVWSNVWGFIYSVASNVWNAILGTVQTVISEVQRVVSTALETIKSIWSAGWETVSSTASGIWEGIMGFFRGVVGTVSGIFQSIADAISTPFRNAFNAIAGFWNSTVGQISFTIPNWVPGVGGNGWSVPGIPMLAEGGVVNRPTLAVIGEAGPEAVIPLSKLSQHMPKQAEGVAASAGPTSIRDELSGMEFAFQIGTERVMAKMVRKGERGLQRA